MIFVIAEEVYVMKITFHNTFKIKFSISVIISEFFFYDKISKMSKTCLNRNKYIFLYLIIDENFISQIKYVFIRLIKRIKMSSIRNSISYTLKIE